MIGMQTKYHVIRKKVEKRMKKRTYRLLCVFASTVLLVTGALTGCSSSGKSGVSKGDGTQQTEENGAEEKKAPKIDGLKYQKTMQLKYATGFDVYYYKGGYKLLDVHDDRQYLIVPEGKKKPADLDKDIVVLKQPLDHIYLAKQHRQWHCSIRWMAWTVSGCQAHRLQTGILIMRKKLWRKAGYCSPENTVSRIMRCW